MTALAERILGMYEDRGPDECWPWLRYRNANGYGVVYIDQSRRSELAHRAMYELHVGQIPRGMLVCHTCDNPSCVNPAHLWVGTHAANNADMYAKDRIAWRYR